MYTFLCRHVFISLGQILYLHFVVCIFLGLIIAPFIHLLTFHVPITNSAINLVTETPSMMVSSCDRLAVFTAGQLSAAAGAAVKLFPVAGCDSGRVYDVNPVGERVL